MLRGYFLRHGLLEFVSIDAVALGGIHENVIAVRSGSLIGRIKQADFENQLAKLGLIVCTYLLGKDFLRGRGVLLDLYLVPLRQSRELAVGKVAIK
jgi:hypothetical protein